MSIEKIRFEGPDSERRGAYYKGRNGQGHCYGVDVWLNDAGLLLIEPLNSRLCIANCVITVPDFKLEEMIAALTKLKDERDARNTELQKKRK